MFSNKTLFTWALQRFRGLQVLLFLMILSTVFFRIFPLEMQKRIINEAIAYQQFDKLLIYCGLYIGAVVLAGVLKYIINVVQAYIGQKILLELRSKLYEHILTLPLGFFRKTPPGMVITSLTSELSAIGEFLGGAIATPVINILTLLTFAGYLAYLNPLLAAVSFVVYPIEIIIIPRLQGKFNRLNQDRIDVMRSMSNVIGEAVSGMHEVHGNAGYGLESKRMGSFAQMLFHIRHRMNIYKFLIKFLNNFFQSLGPFILFLLGGYLTMQGELNLGALVAFLSAYEKLYDPWKELMDYYQDYQDSNVRYRQIVEYFDVQPEFDLERHDDRAPLQLQGNILLEDLSFIVEGQVRILDQVCLDLKAGEQLAVVGLSGSGKSTLAMVIGQLYSYTQGHVKLDGLELKDMSKWDVSRNIGYVAQYPFIFNGTILENLLYAYQSIHEVPQGAAPPSPSREAVLNVIDSVGLWDDILRIGLNSQLKRDEEHDPIAERIVAARKLFLQKHGLELEMAVDLFDVSRFQYHTCVGENITFGSADPEAHAPETLPKNEAFTDFLQECGLLAQLTQLGEEVARQTVSLLRDLTDDAFFFELSPIRQDEFEEYANLVDRLDKMDLHFLEKEDETALLLPALRFIPGKHKMAALPPSLEKDILLARQRFMERTQPRDAGKASRASEYLYTQNVLENLLFGELKQSEPQAVERLSQTVMELLDQQGLIREIIQLGLEFDVGSKGDRLSGGQKQKIAIARTLLKGPSILIFDEATASLDNTSQTRIQQLLNKDLRGKCTLISVVHRLELVRDFDLIAVMKAGKIIELGRYDELMEKKGLFYELARGA